MVVVLKAHVEQGVMARLTRFLTILNIALLPTLAWALDLGSLHWKPVSGQAPYVEIELHDKSQIDPSTIKARIASQEAYQAAGLTYDPALAATEVMAQAGPDGRVVLRLDRVPRDVKTLNLLLVVNNHVSLKLAEYRIDFRQEPRDIQPSLAGTSQFKTQPAAQANPENKTSRLVTKDDEPAAAAARNAVLAWAQAWSRRDVDSYIGAYTSDYAGPDQNGSRQAWMEQRRARILARNSISVALDNLRLDKHGDIFIAYFDQRYQSDGPIDRVHKRLSLVLDNGSWRIKREVILPRTLAVSQSDNSHLADRP